LQHISGCREHRIVKQRGKVGSFSGTNVIDIARIGGSVSFEARATFTPATE